MAEAAATRLTHRLSARVDDISLVSQAHSSHAEHHVDHQHGHHGPFDTSKALQIGSLSFEQVFNAQYNEGRAATARKRFTILTGLMPLFIGVITSGCATVIGIVDEKIGSWRCKTVRDFFVSHGWWQAWLVSTGIMVACALVSGFPVYFGARTKTAGSSGIPQLIGVLNGCDLRKDFSWRHLLTKLWGVAFAVASGLAVGPEGPMIFIGSAVGALLSQLPNSRRLWRFIGAPPTGAGPDVYLRDYMSIGAGCGIAAAFRAPIAGTLFIVEEAASHFKKEEMSKIFFGGLAALEVVILTGGFASLLEYKVEVGSNCSSTPWWFLMFSLFLGCVCGVIGAVFNCINVRVMLFRAKHATPDMRLRRIIEIVVLCLLTSSAWVGAVVCFRERDATSENILRASDGCTHNHWLNQVLVGSTIEIDIDDSGSKTYNPKYIPQGCLYGAQVNPTLCPKAWNISDCCKTGEGQCKDWSARSCQFATQCIGNVSTRSILALHNPEDYCCAFESLDDLKAGNFSVPGNAVCYLELGESVPSLAAPGPGGAATGNFDSQQKGTVGKTSYNEMASLVFVPFKVACQNLFARGVPHMFSISVLLVFFVLFALGSAVTAGSAIPSGLLMPQMIIGGCLGRALSLIVVQMETWLRAYSTGVIAVPWVSSYQPLFADGGPIPSGAVLTPSSSVSLDPGIAALVGAAAFLAGSGRVTLFTTVMMVEITGDPVMIFPVGFATVCATIVGNLINHGLYHSLLDVQSQPYLPDTWQSDELPPGVRVHHMMPRTTPIVVSLNGGLDSVTGALRDNNYRDFPVVDDEGAVMGMVGRKALEEIRQNDVPVTADDLMNVSDLYPLTVRKEFLLEAAYLVFKAMDMRNLVVVDEHHRPIAVMTRFAFLAWRVRERMGESFHELHRLESERRINARGRARTWSRQTSDEQTSFARQDSA